MRVATQVAANALVTSAVYALVGLSFLIPFRVARFFNLAHGAVLTCAAYLAFFFARELALPLSLSFLLAVLTATSLGCSFELGIYRQLRRRGASSLVMLLASLGVYVLVQNIVSLVFGDAARALQQGEVSQGVKVLGAVLTASQIAMIAASAVAVAGMHFVMRHTRTGVALRAVACDAELAGASGINSERVNLLASAVGSALVAAGGVLFALVVDMTPTMGMNVLLMAIVAMIVGGAKPLGVVLGALLLAATQHAGTWFLGARWQDPLAFFVLLAFLLLRPYGVLGAVRKRATV